jgi:hypothetical protein
MRYSVLAVVMCLCGISSVRAEDDAEYIYKSTRGVGFEGTIYGAGAEFDFGAGTCSVSVEGAADINVECTFEDIPSASASLTCAEDALDARLLTLTAGTKSLTLNCKTTRKRAPKSE